MCGQSRHRKLAVRRAVRRETTMAEEITGLATLDVRGAMSESSSQAFCSMRTGTAKEKAALYNATSNPNHKVGDYINKTIRVKDIYVEAIELEDDESGDTITAPRIVLVDVDGDSYQAVSKGVFNSLIRLINTFGQPTWEEGLPLIVRQISLGKNQMLTLEIDVASL